MASQQSLLTFFRTSLQSFNASKSSLRMLRTVAFGEEAKTSIPHQLMVLDSSFNPPTRAHLHIATSALHAYDAQSQPTRLVLLLATQNADKPAQPASFEHRLCMMTLLATDVLKALDSASNVAVDIGVTKLPYFIGKAKALSSPDTYNYGASGGIPVQQVHLVGYDTLIRIFNTKYYPPDHDFASLQALFEHHRLRVTYRADSEWGSGQDQRAYLEAIRNGEREAEGAPREWAQQIELVESNTKEDGAVSSTKVRRAAKESDLTQLEELCSPEVANWVSQEGLYKEDG